MAKRRKAKYDTAAVAKFIAAAIVIIVAVFFVINIVNGNLFGDSKTVADQNSFFNIANENDAAIIIDEEQSENTGKYIDGRYYIQYDTVWNSINSGFYLEENTGILYMTLPSQSLTWTVNDGTGYLYLDSDGIYYISADCIAAYSDIELSTYTEPYRVVIRTQWDGLQYADVAEDAVIRVSASGKADIAVSCTAGEQLTLITTTEDDETVSDGWSKVMSQDGHIGYIRSEYLSGAYDAPAHETNSELIFSSLSTGQTVKMAWHYIGSTEDNANLDAVMEGVHGLNIICPTWFSIGDTSGNIISYADASYVQNAANTYGMSVWGMVSGYGGEDSTTGEVLSSYENRQRCISQLIGNALTCGISGINIDFEDIDEEYAPAYIQFLRELTVQAHANGIIVSVDNYVPGYTDQYRRDAQNDIVDYVVMMGYDEHTAYTAEYGSVASLTYVQEGVAATLEEVDADKLILGVPFYTRGWIVPFGSDAFESETLAMSNQQTFIDEHGISLSWDSSAGQYTGSAEGSDARYYIWVEDASSLAEKLSLVQQYGLAGASAWRVGMETSDVWDTWETYLSSDS